ncbi:ABC transporter ATP-binding protein [Acidaminobacterium chupaoyuni]
MLIELKRISKIYNEGRESEVRALDDVSLTIEKGEFTAILGQSGSGKSTMMNILGCLDIPTYGEYWLEEENVSNIPPRRLAAIRNRNIGFIFQGFNLIPALTALENVELPLVYRGMPHSQRHELSVAALESVGLGERMDHRPSELSGGQQQRVAIARAIAAKPPVIMADEPTGNLDTKAGAEIMLKLCALNDEGTTILLITHDMQLAHMAKRIVRLQDGKIISDETPSAREREIVLEEVARR